MNFKYGKWLTSVSCGGCTYMQCEAVREGGSTCDAQAIKKDRYCFAHSQLPEIIKKRAEAKSIGGQHGRKKMLTPADDEISVKSPHQIIDLLETTINDVRMNRIATNQANCIGYLCNIMTKVFEQDQLEDRITTIERVLQVKKGR